ncbi:MAG: glycosyltransferase [Bacteroidia bacterium]|nr:glycosyltransferase [Bacteroidia bacterium]
MFKFSIITVNYNNFQGLQKTFKSIQNQTFLNFEFIVIDGGSNDGSQEFIILNSKNISYWVSEKDNGVYHAMNKGLKVATGDYCIFLNSGDYFYESSVLGKVSSLIKYDAVFVYGLIEWETTKQLWNPKRDLKDYEMAFQSLIPHQACFFKTELLNKMGGYKEKYKVISDWGLMLEILKNEHQTQKIELIISICENQGISSSLVHLIRKERFDYLKKYAFTTYIKGYLFKLKHYLS